MNPAKARASSSKSQGSKRKYTSSGYVRPNDLGGNAYEDMPSLSSRETSWQDHRRSAGPLQKTRRLLSPTGDSPSESCSPVDGESQAIHFLDDFVPGLGTSPFASGPSRFPPAEMSSTPLTGTQSVLNPVKKDGLYAPAEAFTFADTPIRAMGLTTPGDPSHPSTQSAKADSAPSVRQLLVQQVEPREAPVEAVPDLVYPLEISSRPTHPIKLHYGGYALEYDLALLPDEAETSIALLRTTMSDPGVWLMFGAHYRRTGRPQAARAVVKTLLETQASPEGGTIDLVQETTKSNTSLARPAKLLLAACEMELGRSATDPADKKGHMDTAQSLFRAVYGTASSNLESVLGKPVFLSDTLGASTAKASHTRLPSFPSSASWQARPSKLSDAMPQEAEVKARVASLEAQVRATSKENASLRRELDAVQHARGRMERQLNGAEREVRELERRLSDAREDVIDARRKREDAEQKVDMLEERNRGAEERMWDRLREALRADGAGPGTSGGRS